MAEKLSILGLAPEDLFHHVVAVLHAPAYRAENAGALRMDWPRVPFPIPPTGCGDRPTSAGVWQFCSIPKRRFQG